MRHFPIYLDTDDQDILVIGAGPIAAAKLRILTKTQARLHVFGSKPVFAVNTWAKEGRITLYDLPPTDDQIQTARLVYAATGDDAQDQDIAARANAAGVFVNIVDNLDASDFITPALVDRAPVTVAIGTEGASPVLARKLKALNEEALHPDMGLIAAVGKAFRPQAEALPYGPVRRAFWQRYYDEIGPAHASQGHEALNAALHDLLEQMQHQPARPAQIALIQVPATGADDLTHRARRFIHDADVIIHDAEIDPSTLELARREAIFINAELTPTFERRDPRSLRDILIKRARPDQKVLRLTHATRPVQKWALYQDYAALRALGHDVQLHPSGRPWVHLLAAALGRLSHPIASKTWGSLRALKRKAS